MVLARNSENYHGQVFPLITEGRPCGRQCIKGCEKYKGYGVQWA